MVNYGIIYTLPFKSRKELSYTVEIQKENYEGRPLELTGGDSPFSIELNDEDFLYTPARFSTATVHVVGDDYLQSLYSIGYQQFRVNLKQDNKVVWTGFVKPELYTQDYTSTIFDLEIECMSALSTLEYLDYKQAGEEARVFVSLWDLLKKCITSSNGLYDSVYIPHVYASSESDYNTGVNVLQNMKVSEQDFFDEDDKPMKLKEVLEEICKLLNWTVCDWKGSLYFVDIDHIGEYYKYSPDLETKLGSIFPNLLNVQKVGYSGNGHALDVLTGRNKVTVKTSNYPVGVLTPDEDFNDLELAQTIDSIQDKNSGLKSICHKIVLLPKILEMKQWKLASDESHAEKVSPEWVIANKGIANSFLGAMPIRFCEYEMKKEGTQWNPNISNYSYEDGIQVRWIAESYKQDLHSMDIDRSPVVVVRGPSAIYSDGAFAISGQMCQLHRSDLGVIPHEQYWGRTAELICSLRIGELWYNGSDWVSSDNPFRPVNFKVRFTGLFSKSKWVDVINTKTLDMPYGDLTGYVIHLRTPKVGDLEFTLYGSRVEAGFANVDNKNPYGMLLKNFKLEYGSIEFLVKNDNSDRTYENVVNEKFINELDEIEFKISSYNNDGACYSKVILNGEYLTDNLYSSIENKLVRPEEHLIRRIIKQYGATKNKLTLILLNDGSITPITRLSDKNKPDKYFIVTGGTIDYGMDQFECIMIEV